VGEVAKADTPPILVGRHTATVEKQVRSFYLSVAEMFERWVSRSDSVHTQRAYRQDVMKFVSFMGLQWPDDASILLRVRVADVQDYRESLNGEGAAPKSIIRRLSSLSGFYKFMREIAADHRLPVMIPNPAHSQFLPRGSADPVEETQSLTLAKARRLLSLPKGDDVLEYRDRAILAFYLYSGARIATGCRLEVKDFRFDEHDPKVCINEKGKKRRTIGLHGHAAQAVYDYLQEAGHRSGPLFRVRLNPRSRQLAKRGFSRVSMWRLIQGYLQRLPGAMREVESPEGQGDKLKECIYTPHSLRATTATLLLDAGVDITAVQELLGHKHVTTTQIYDKRRRASAESASHMIPI
jgi:integrase/recombinase XerC